MTRIHYSSAAGHLKGITEAKHGGRSSKKARSSDSLDMTCCLLNPMSHRIRITNLRHFSVHFLSTACFLSPRLLDREI